MCLFSCRCSAGPSTPALQRAAVPLKSTALQRCGTFKNPVHSAARAHPCRSIIPCKSLKILKVALIYLRILTRKKASFLAAATPRGPFGHCVPGRSGASKKTVLWHIKKKKKDQPPTGLPSSSGVFLLTSGRSF